MLLRFVLIVAALLSNGAFAAVLSIAHRGDSLQAPENTMAAFRSALGKADLVETDGQVTSDGYIVLMHDGTVDRTTDGTGTVASKTLAQIKLLDAGSWFSSAFVGEDIPTLEEMITNTLPTAVPLIERKAGSASAYVNEIRRLGVVTNVVIQAFDWNFLAQVHALEPRIRLGALGSGTFTEATLTSIINTGAGMVAWEHSSVTPAMLTMVRNAGLSLFVWTVDGPKIRTYIEMGVDGIISNDPGAVKDYQAPPQTNGPVNLPAGLVSYWSMDDGLSDPFATVVRDSSGTNHATLIRNDGASHWFAADLARVGGCLKVEGTNAYVNMPASPGMDINTNGVTISMWLKLPLLPSQLPTNNIYGPIFDSSTDCYVFYLDRGNKELRFKVTDVKNHAARPGISDFELKLNEWIHVVGTYAGDPAPSKTTIYMNGTARDSHTGSDSSSPVGLTGNVKPGQAVSIGREGPTGTTYFTGFVDEVALWKRALSPSEVYAIYAGGVAGKSLADLMRGPSDQIRCTGAVPMNGNTIQIQFTSEGPWQNFRLLRAESLNGAFQAVEGLTLTDLGGGKRAFNYVRNGGAAEYFRVEAQ